MDFDREKLMFELMDCFSEETWDKYDFERLVGDYLVDGDFIVIRGSNFTACFDRFDLCLVNFEIQEVSE